MTRRASQGPARGPRVRSAAGAVLLLAGIGALICAGYLWTHQIFFRDLGIEEVAVGLAGAERTEMIFADRGVFDAFVLGDYRSDRSRKLELWYVPHEGAAAPEALDLLLELPAEPLAGRSGDEIVGSLRVREARPGGGADVTEVPIAARRHQEIGIELDPRPLERNKLTFAFRPNPGSGIGQALMATRMQVDLVGPALLWSAAALVLVVLSFAVRGVWPSRLAWLLVATLVLLSGCRAGAFVSNEFFPQSTHGTASPFKTAIGHAKHFVKAGEWYPHMEKRLGTKLVPMLTLLADPVAKVTPSRAYPDLYPTPRYVVFVLEAIALSLLVVACWRYLSPGVAAAFPPVYAAFFPFLVDLYRIEDDSLFILYTLPLTALVLKVSSQRRILPLDYAGFALVMFLFAITKGQGAYLVVLLPVAIFVERLVRTRRWRQPEPALLAAALLAGVAAAAALQWAAGPRDPEAQPGFPYASSKLWEAMFARPARFLETEDVPFLEKGKDRDRLVAERAGLPPDEARRMRHSELATEEIYRPTVISTLRHRPDIHASAAVIRMLDWSLLFYGHHPAIGEEWVLHEAGPGRELSRPLGERLLSAIRRNRALEVLPLVAVTDLFDLSDPGERLLDGLLLLAAIWGVVRIRRLDFAVVAFGMLAVRVVFLTLVHENLRYFNHTRVPLLVGLAVTLVAVLLGLARTWGSEGDRLAPPAEERSG